ncbi:hypothetical protein ACFPRL_08340 [Pseudoclavibacter helvolus]
MHGGARRDRGDHRERLIERPPAARGRATRRRTRAGRGLAHRRTQGLTLPYCWGLEFAFQTLLLCQDIRCMLTLVLVHHRTESCTEPYDHCNTNLRV